MKRRDLIEVIEAYHEATKAVLANWSQGDLAGAVNELEGAQEQGDAALKWWASDLGE